jgi:GNAT superfamily N-acetyltransferase
VALTDASVATRQDARVQVHEVCRLDGREHRVDAATERDVPGAVAALTAAFEGYAWTRWIVPEHDHARRLADLFELTVARVGLPFGDVTVATCPGRGEVVGAAVVLRPDRPVPGEVWAALAPAEQELLGDRLAAADDAEALCAGLRPTEPHLTVGTIGVRPDHQGRGIATRLLGPALRTAHELGAPVYLETSSLGNLAMYRRLGFEVTGEVRVAPDGPMVWAMRHEP